MENIDYSDIKSLFVELLNQEELVKGIYSKLIEELSDGEMKTMLNKILEDENRHIINAKKILQILEE